MGKVFEVGKMYDRAETGYDPQKVIRRTPKTITCVNAFEKDARPFTQRIHVDEDGTEWVHDIGLPKRHRWACVCKASWEVDE